MSISRWRSAPARSSIAKNSRPSCVMSAWWMRTTLGWSMRPTLWISCTKSRPSSEAGSMPAWRTLTATSRSMASWRARYTVPKRCRARNRSRRGNGRAGSPRRDRRARASRRRARWAASRRPGATGACPRGRPAVGWRSASRAPSRPGARRRERRAPGATLMLCMVTRPVRASSASPHSPARTASRRAQPESAACTAMTWAARLEARSQARRGALRRGCAPTAWEHALGLHVLQTLAQPRQRQGGVLGIVVVERAGDEGRLTVCRDQRRRSPPGPPTATGCA